VGAYLKHAASRGFLTSVPAEFDAVDYYCAFNAIIDRERVARAACAAETAQLLERIALTRARFRELTGYDADSGDDSGGDENGGGGGGDDSGGGGCGYLDAD